MISKENKGKRAILFGGFGEHNIGDTILLVNSLRILKGLKINIFTYNPERTRKNLMKNNLSFSDIDITYTGRWGISDPSKKGIKRFLWIFKSIRDIYKCDIFLIGPGTLMHDETNRLYIWFWLSRIIIAVLFRKKIAFWGAGIGSVESPIAKVTLKWIAKRTAFSITRDRGSREMMIKNYSFDPKKTINLIDLGVSENDYKKPKKVKVNKKGLKIGINFRYLEEKHFKGNKKRMKENYIKTIGYFLNKLKLHNKTIELFFFPMCLDVHQNDLKMYHILHEKLKNSSLGEINIVNNDQNIERFKKEMKKMDLFIGVRLHSVVLSTSLSIPSLAISYSEKVDYYMKEIDCNKLLMQSNNILYSELVEKFNYMVKNSYSISKKLIEKNKELKKRIPYYTKILNKELI